MGIEYVVSLLIAFALGAAWKSMSPQKVKIVFVEKEAGDEEMMPSRRDEDAMISLAQAQQAEANLKEKQRRIPYNYAPSGRAGFRGE